jgi:hypothetical protein
MLSALKHHLLNLPGWRTRRKTVVIESDDWGSVRMASKAVYKALLGKGIRVDNLCYNRYDSLASEADLAALFEVLASVRDQHGRPAVLTANTIVANPDFEKIKATDYAEYHCEPFTATLQKYPQHSQSFQYWRDGMEAGLFAPQFHGREHLNVRRWMRALRQDIGDVRLAFEYGMYDLSTSLVIGENSFMEAFNFEDEAELAEQKKVLAEGLSLFEQLFGYRSSTFIAPCYVWSSQLNESLLDNGVRTFQGTWFQKEPLAGRVHRFQRRFHYLGQKNRLGQRYLVRNAFFEPAEKPDVDWIDQVLTRAKIAFQWGKPLIIGSHRVNYIGCIDQANRDRNLSLLKKLLKALLQRWPDLEFMSSSQLSDLMHQAK